MIQGHRIVFAAPGQAEFQPFTMDEKLKESEFLIETWYSLISPGTELAWFSGVQKDVSGERFQYPIYPGYCNVGRVMALGRAVGPYQEGDLVATHGPHASHARIDFLSLPSQKVPPGLSPIQATFSTMGEIALASVRLADFSLGDRVVVIGLGLVGNLAAQLFRLAGAEVLAADLLPSRLDMARQCGVENLVNPREASLEETVMDWTHGQGAQVVVESVGATELILQAVDLTRRLGQVVLLGTPRRRAMVNATPAFYRAHMEGITIRGALRGLHYGVHQGPFSRHSSRGDLAQVLEWLRDGRLKVEPLLTHHLAPDQCQAAYQALERERARYLGVIFDWTADGRPLWIPSLPGGRPPGG